MKPFLFLIAAALFVSASPVMAAPVVQSPVSAMDAEITKEEKPAAPKKKEKKKHKKHAAACNPKTAKACGDRCIPLKEKCLKK